MTASGAFIRLGVSFDAIRLQCDAAAVDSWARERQPGRYHDGEWMGIALRSPGGDANAAPSRPAFRPYRICAAGLQTPYLRQVLRLLPGPKLSARLLYLPAGGVIREHTDDLLGFWHGLVRVHVPIHTSESVDFFIGGERCVMKEGEAWYGDFARPHAVFNRSDRVRVHLVVDVIVTRAFLRLFPSGFLRSHVGALTLTPCRHRVARSALNAFVASVLVPPEIVALLAPLWSIGGSATRRTTIEVAVRTGLRVDLAVKCGEIVASTGGRPFLVLEPCEESTLRIRDWPAGIQLHAIPDGPRPARLVLELRLPGGPAMPHGQRVDLPRIGADL